MKKVALLLFTLFIFAAAAMPLHADCNTCGGIIFYGGDFDPNNGNADGLANENDAIIGGTPYGAATYQNFTMNTADGIAALFTNNLSGLNPSSGYWEIRSGLSEGNGGTLIASGTESGDNFTHTPTGRSGFGYTEYTDQIQNLWINLPAGTYWFAVVPNDPSNANRSFNSNTFGLNAIGSQTSNLQYFSAPAFGANFTNANNEGPFPIFSSGVWDVWLPEPSSFILLGTGLLGAVATYRRRLR